MRLSVAASYFDKLLCVDAFNSGTYFYGQLDVFDDSKRDGATVVRRVLSVASAVVIPARRVITAAGDQWLIGANQVDSYRGSTLRNKYVIQRAQGAALIKTPGQALSTGGTSTYGSKLWVKDLKEVDVSSKLEGFFNLYLPSAETVAPGNIITLGARAHLVRNIYLSAAGFLTAEVDELASDAIGVGVYTALNYAPAADDRTVSSTTAVNVLKLRYQDLFSRASAVAPKMDAGDLKVLIRKADVATAKVNHQMTLSGEKWEILGVQSEDDCWGLHVRKAAD